MSEERFDKVLRQLVAITVPESQRAQFFAALDGLEYDDNGQLKDDDGRDVEYDSAGSQVIRDDKGNVVATSAEGILPGEDAQPQRHDEIAELRGMVERLVAERDNAQTASVAAQEASAAEIEAARRLMAQVEAQGATSAPVVAQEAPAAVPAPATPAPPAPGPAATSIEAGADLTPTPGDPAELADPIPTRDPDGNAPPPASTSQN